MLGSIDDGVEGLRLIYRHKVDGDADAGGNASGDAARWSSAVGGRRGERTRGKFTNHKLKAQVKTTAVAVGAQGRGVNGCFKEGCECLRLWLVRHLQYPKHNIRTKSSSSLTSATASLHRFKGLGGRWQML